jgi:hypothetical protein
MNSNDKLWSLVLLAVCVLAAIIAGCDVVNTANKLNVLEKVQDPIAVSCAWSLEPKAVCMAKVLNK